MATSKIVKATIILAVFTLLSRVLGLVRDLILASTFGAGELLDSYWAAFRLPDFLFNFFILGTLTVAFLPVFNRELVRDKSAADELASSVYSISITGMAVLAFVFFIFTPLLINLIVPGFSEAQQILTQNLTRIMLITPVIFTASSLASILTQSYNRFLPTAVAPLFYNLGIITGAVFLYKPLGPAGLALGVILGAIMHAVINIGALRGLPTRLRFSFNYTLSQVKEVWRMYLPRLLAFDNLQISLMVGSIIGSLLATGSIAIFNFAENLQAAPLGIFALSFAVAAFPDLSKTWSAGKMEEFKEIINKTILQILFFIVPVSGVAIILRAQVVRLVLGRGKFGWEETILTAQTLGVLAFSLFAQSLTPLLARAFYAAHNTVIPVLVSVITALTNIIFAVVFSRTFGVVGLAMAAALAAILSLLMLFIFLKSRIGKLDGLALMEGILKILISAVFCITAAYAALYAIEPFLSTRTTFGLFIQTSISAAVGAVAYLAVGLLLNLKESNAFMGWVKTSLIKVIRPARTLLEPPSKLL